MRPGKLFGIPLIVFITCLFQSPIEGALQFALGFSTTVKVIKTIINVAEFAIDIEGFFTGKKKNKYENNEESIKAIEVMIHASTGKIMNTILLQSKLDDIDAAVIALHSSLKDLKKIIKADNKATFDIYVSNFIHLFEEHDTMKHIRFLPELLTYKIPSIGSDLISEIMLKTRCNMTAISDFADFYLKLVSDGIALQVIYFKLTSSLSPEQVLKDEWQDEIPKIRQAFELMLTGCVERFPTFAQADVNNAVNIDNLARANQQRYLLKWSDVIFYASMGTEQFHYMKYKTGRLFRHKNANNNKVAVFGRRGEPMSWNAADIEEKLKAASFTEPSDTDETAAKIVAEEIEKYITNTLGYSIGVILVFFDGEDFKSTGIRVDTDSPVVQYVMDGVSLEYCFDSGFECYARDKFSSKETSSGKFKAYIYPKETDDDGFETDRAGSLDQLITHDDDDDDFETDRAGSLHSLDQPISLLFAVILCFVWMI